MPGCSGAGAQRACPLSPHPYPRRCAALGTPGFLGFKKRVAAGGGWLQKHSERTANSFRKRHRPPGIVHSDGRLFEHIKSKAVPEGKKSFAQRSEERRVG